MAKILAVLSTFVPNGQVERGIMIRSCSPPFDYLVGNENKLDTIKFTLACHEHYHSGEDYTLIIVDSQSPDSEWNDLKAKLPHDVYERENVGFSFGSHKWAWEKFGKKYDYYLFMEQDCVPTKDGWLTEILNKFLEKKTTGVVGNYIECHPTDAEYVKGMEEYFPNILKKERIHNLDGFWSFTSSDILDECGLCVAPVEPNGKIPDVWNELGFQQTILDKGYKIDSFSETHRFYRGVSLRNLPEHKYKLPITPLVLGHTRDWAEKEHFKWYEKN